MCACMPFQKGVLDRVSHKRCESERKRSIFFSGGSEQEAITSPIAVVNDGNVLRKVVQKSQLSNSAPEAHLACRV